MINIPPRDHRQRRLVGCVRGAATRTTPAIRGLQKATSLRCRPELLTLRDHVDDLPPHLHTLVASTAAKPQQASFTEAHLPLLHQVTMALLVPLGHAQQIGWQSASPWQAPPGGTVPHFTFGRLQSPAALDVLPRLEIVPASKPPAQATGVVELVELQADARTTTLARTEQRTGRCSPRLRRRSECRLPSMAPHTYGIRQRLLLGRFLVSVADLGAVSPSPVHAKLPHHKPGMRRDFVCCR